jgi:site-specific DNA-methyltransferase (adenine-specific)
MNTSNIGGRNRQRPQYTFQPNQVFEHVRELIQSYELSYPGLKIEYEKQRNGLFIRVVKSKKMSAKVPDDIQGSLEPYINQILQGDYLEHLVPLPSTSIPIMISDIPYVDELNESDEDDTAYLSYLEWMRECLIHLYRVGTPDCRLCLNVQADSGTNGTTRSLYADVLQLAKTVGFQYRSEVTWYQPIYRSSVFGRGSASSPTIVNPVERIMILFKHQWERIGKQVSTLGSDSRHLTHGFWQIDLDEAQDVSPHLARLPLQIPINLLKLLSYKDDIVLDPFGAAGSVAVAAKQLGRPFISVEPSEYHSDMAQERLARVA